MPRRKRDTRESGESEITRPAEEPRRTRKHRVTESPVKDPDNNVCGICGRGKQRGNPLHKVVLNFQVDDTGYTYNDWMCKECLEYFPGFLAGSLYFGGLATNKGKLSNFMLPPVQLTLSKSKSPKK